MSPVEPPEGNGNVLRYKVERLEDEVRDMRADVAKVPVLETKVDSLLDGWRAVRNAFLAAAGGLVLLAASIVWQSL